MRPLILPVSLLLALGASCASVAAPPTADEVSRYAAALLADTYPADGPGAAVLVARGDEVLFRGAAGRDQVERDDPLSPDDTFRIGSITKQFSAAAVMTLVEAGKVKLDDPLAKFVPDYPNGASITVRQLLDHTSGVRSYTSIPGVMEGSIRNDVSTAGLIASFKDQPADFAPGQGWAYNNSGYVLVGAVIESTTGQAWHEYLHRTFFKPLGMSHTGYGHDPAVAAAHVRGWSRDGEGKVVPARPLSMTQPHAAGALVSSVDDLHRWNRALHGGHVLSAESYALMTTPQGKAKEQQYGFGLFAGTIRNVPVLSHGGGIFGFSTALTYVPGPEVSVVVLQNSDEDTPGKQGPDRLARRLVAFALGDPYPEPVAVEVSAGALAEAEGVYTIDAGGTRTLRVVDGRLTSQRSGGSRSGLIPIGRDEFLFEDGFNRLRLERDADGKVVAMRFFPMGEGEGQVAQRSDAPLPSARSAVVIDAATRARVMGEYAGLGTVLSVFEEDGVLKVRLGAQQALALKAESATRFFVEEVDAVFEFDAEGEVAPRVTLHQAGQAIEFARTP